MYTEKMRQSIFPVRLMAVLQNLRVEKNSLVWIAQSDNNGTTVSLKWSNSDINSVRPVNTLHVSKLLTSCLTAIKDHVIKYCMKAYENSGVNLFWSVKNSGDPITLLFR